MEKKDYDKFNKLITFLKKNDIDHETTRTHYDNEIILNVEIVEDWTIYERIKTYGKKQSFKQQIKDTTFNILKKLSVKSCTKKINKTNLDTY